MPTRYPCLLESVNGASKTARYDILFAFPQNSIDDAENFLEQLDDAWRAARSDERDELPFHGGWFVFLSYELAAEIEPSLRLHAKHRIADRDRCALSGRDHRRSHRADRRR